MAESKKLLSSLINTLVTAVSVFCGNSDNNSLYPSLRVIDAKLEIKGDDFTLLSLCINETVPEFCSPGSFCQKH